MVNLIFLSELINWKAVDALGHHLLPSSPFWQQLPAAPGTFFVWPQRAAEGFWRRTPTAGTSGEGRPVEAGGSTGGSLRGPEAVEAGVRTGGAWS